MNLPELLEKKQKELANYIGTVVPRKIGKMAIDHIHKAFDEEGLTDKQHQPWQEVKRRLPENLKKGKRGKPLKKQPAYNRKKILDGKGNLKRSFIYTTSPESIEIRSDSKYAAVHNYGTENAGRNKNVKIPKREFLTPYIPQALEQKIVETIENDLTKILNS